MSLKELNGKLTAQPYVSGFTPSKDDAALFRELFGNNQAVIQWAARMASYYQSERDELLAGPKAAAPAAPKKAAVAEVKKPAAKKDDDDDVDLFGEETEEEKAALEAKKAADAAKKAEKPKKTVINKSSILLDVKVWEDSTDLEALAAKIKSNERDGLLWGAHKLAPVAYGVKKLQLLLVIEDDKVSSDDIEDLINQYEEEVQSIDIVAWNKV
jgi:elongation factor 1-beta